MPVIAGDIAAPCVLITSVFMKSINALNVMYRLKSWKSTCVLFSCARFLSAAAFLAADPDSYNSRCCASGMRDDLFGVNVGSTYVNEPVGLAG